MDRASLVGEPIAYDAADRMEAAGLSPLETGRKMIAIGLSRLHQCITDKHELAEELNWLAQTLSEEAEDLLKSAH